MRDETHICQNCKQSFIIAASDFAFYEKIKVPAPTWCPECRNMRRLAWRNERVLYMRICDLCKKPTLSIYHPSAPYIVYCRPCWWSDGWDPMVQGRAFDFSRSFFEQYDELLKAVPRCALMNTNLQNSEYCNEAEDLKDSYMAICTFWGERLMYTYWIGWSNDLVDTSYTLKSNIAYECQDLRESYNCKYVYDSDHMIDSMFCVGCKDSMNCFMCVNLNHKSYCIRNKQYTKESYERELAKIDFGSFKTVQRLKDELWTFSRQFPRRYAHAQNAENCIGDYLNHCKDVYWGFDILEQENTRYVFDGASAKDSMDTTQAGVDCELMYEVQSCARLYNVRFAHWTWGGSDSEYVDACRNYSNLLGCSGLRSKHYCIFNKQYSKDEFQTMREQIVQHMRTTGEYGQYFPVGNALYAYNESVAQQWYPKTKEEVLSHGWKWRDDLPGKYGPGTISWDQVPDRIQDIPDDIVGQIFSCTTCRKQYKIVKPEHAFYKKYLIPFPRQCPDCRFYERLKLRNPRKLWHRECMCERAGHAWHTGRCKNEFETAYAPERPEIVYCEKCYQAEVI